MARVKKNKNYIRSFPADQNMIDIFKGEWSSRFPTQLSITSGGTADLFEDLRLQWVEDNGVSFRGKSILELGPLEGGHTWMMEQLQASEILAVEAHERSFLKCLITKELTGMKVSRFLYGDFEKYLENCDRRFDICLASGVLYHSLEPLKLLKNICRVSNTILLWTHYYDDLILDCIPEIKERFLSSVNLREDSFQCQGHPFLYQESANYQGFCGGTMNQSIWLEKEDIKDFLLRNEFSKIDFGFDHPHHPFGPAILMLARK